MEEGRKRCAAGRHGLDRPSLPHRSTSLSQSRTWSKDSCNKQREGRVLKQSQGARMNSRHSPPHGRTLCVTSYTIMIPSAPR